jgi:hypothetical protein
MSSILIVSSIACTTGYPTDTPGVTQRGEHVRVYDGPELRAELVYSWASRNLGDEWLLVKLSMTAANRGSTEVEASSVRMRTPDGRELPLVDNGTFQRAYPELRFALETTDAWGPPLRNLEAPGRPCEHWFLAPRFSFADRQTLLLFPGQWCSGPLVFRPAMGVQAGRWVLEIDLEESLVRIPFELFD